MLTVMRAAWLADQGEPNNLESSICKAKAGSAVRRITQGCIEILGPLDVRAAAAQWARAGLEQYGPLA